MTLRLQIISDQRRLLGEHATIVFGDRGGRIGRAADNDWVLPDPRRYLSAHHAAIRCENGQFFIEDMSTNGVYANEADIPIGRNNRLLLQDGYTLRLGDYQFRVNVDPIEVRTSLSDDLVAVDKVQPLRRGGEAVPPPIPSLLDSTHLPFAAVPSVAGPNAGDSGGTGIEGSSRMSAIFDVRAGLHAFCRGAGIDVSEIKQDADLRVLLLAGQLLRESLLGLQALVRAQREFQHALGTDVTVSSVDGPAPDAASPADYLMTLLKGQEANTLDAVKTLRDWFDAGQRHEAAVPKALSVALPAFLHHLEPEGIEGRAHARGSLEAAWPLYVELFRSLTHAARGDLPRQFQEAFSQAYSRPDA